MATRWDELIADYDKIGTVEGQAQFIIYRTGLSDECIRGVLGHLITQPLGGDEWDLEAQARKVGVSVDEYVIAMTPLVQMSLEQKQTRMQEIKTRIARGEDPGLSEDEHERIRKWKAFVETIARQTSEEEEVVTTILFAVIALSNRQHEILEELMRLKASGNCPSRCSGGASS